ncbi:TPA: fluoride efflux transporter CrcB [Legionella pneumophila]|uniref:fluoride efflux transporter CrcB n=1 Tax=Legionella pneumophila TaxID=446 RepID=UPI0007870AD0|nr:fluoride efflux transporter CrcB [Legionella pneumophila]MDW8879620.1 fluoride efflux transporter CrcB [Legionella pneumophila subsp. fraseri]MDW8962611.1 fluoride efflux transporter CrcB [Legionella pneumophila subsp. fraseri]MDW9036606.1 fluoride efflux transporter CrcB [Legionella pneumophila subsp. fraseri]MDW9039810.1 fluoride efflux transporter CrcB [Legionella pneumophila subsp. fraseri]MDW9042800.1 fluoride efflux transporter CrcB [Legionella pneumophila subsp. fraseri]
MVVAPYLAVAIGGSLGAVSRYLVTIMAQNTWGIKFPYGTLLVNTIGSFLAGFFLIVLTGRFSAEESFRLFLFTGFLGAFTTFSSFAAESLFMFEQGYWFKLITNILVNNVGSLSMVFIGTLVAKYVLLGHQNPI